MFDLDPEKLFVLGVVAVVVLGPGRLPQAARTVGRVIGQLRAVSASVQAEMKGALGEPGEALTSALHDLRPGGVRHAVRLAASSALATPTGPSPRAGSPVPVPPPAAAAGEPAVPDDPNFN